MVSFEKQKTGDGKTTYTRRGCFKMALIPGIILGIPFLLVLFGMARQSLEASARQAGVSAMYEAYEAQDCATTLERATSIINDPLYRYPQVNEARDLERTCNYYIEAQTAEDNGNLGEALGRYVTTYSISYDKQGDPLGIVPRIKGFFDDHEAQDLFHKNSCIVAHIRYLREIIDSEIMPAYELGCAQFLQAAQDYPPAIADYEAIIEAYPDSEQANIARDAIPFALLEQSTNALEAEAVTATQYSSAIDAVEEFLSTYPDHASAEDATAMLPTLYLAYAQSLLAENTSSGNFERALDALVSFRENYPDHPDYETADTLYADALLSAGIASSQPDATVGTSIPGLTDLWDGKDTASASFDRASKYLQAFIDTYPQHPEIETAQQTLADVLYNAGTYSTDVVSASQRTSFGTPAPNFFNTGPAPVVDYSRAIIFFTQFVDRFPDDERADDVRTKLEDLLKLQEAIAGSIPQPDAIPIAGDETILIIQNASPYTMRISLIGAEFRNETLPACETCATYTSAPATCPTDGPVGRYTLRPGGYQINVSSGEGNVTPFFGLWQLNGGFEYPNCFFIVERAR